MKLATGSLACLIFAVSMSAGTITYSDSGTFSAATPTSTYSAPNETWSFSFTVDTNPVVFGVLPGDYFDVPFTGFTYSLNGSALAIIPANIEFFNSGDGGLFNLCMISTACDSGFYFQGPQMYTGPESAPKMVSGAFTSTSLAINTGTGYITQPNTTVQGVSSSVPEPSTLLTLITGLLALAGIRYSGLRIGERCRIIPVSVAAHRCSGSVPAITTERATAL
jgi:hypothetical protein